MRAPIFLLLLMLAGCGGDEPPPAENYAPLRYDYLKQLRLNVASVDVQDVSAPQGSQDVTAQDPAPPAQILTQMAHDRLFPAGVAGRAVFTVQAASITQVDNGTLDGQLAVQLEIVNAAGAHVAEAEARVARQHVPGSDPENLRNNLYEMTHDMMSDMNVELEFQIRRSMRDWLVSNTSVPAPVTAIPLTPAPPPPEAPAPPPPPMPDLGEPQPPQMSPPPGYLQPVPGPPP